MRGVAVPFLALAWLATGCGDGVGGPVDAACPACDACPGVDVPADAPGRGPT